MRWPTRQRNPLNGGGTYGAALPRGFTGVAHQAATHLRTQKQIHRQNCNEREQEMGQKISLRRKYIVRIRWCQNCCERNQKNRKFRRYNWNERTKNRRKQSYQEIHRQNWNERTKKSEKKILRIYIVRIIMMLELECKRTRHGENNVRSEVLENINAHLFAWLTKI